MADEKKKQTVLTINQLQNEWVQEKMDLHENLEYQFRENLLEMGKGHQEASDQVRSIVGCGDRSPMCVVRLA